MGNNQHFQILGDIIIDSVKDALRNRCKQALPVNNALYGPYVNAIAALCKYRPLCGLLSYY